MIEYRAKIIQKNKHLKWIMNHYKVTFYWESRQNLAPESNFLHNGSFQKESFYFNYYFLAYHNYNIQTTFWKETFKESILEYMAQEMEQKTWTCKGIMYQ